MSSSRPPRPPKLPDAAAELLPRAEQQLVELSALTGGLAHEIRNPLSTLKVHLQLLDEDWRQVEQPDERRPCDPQDVARRSRGRVAALLAEANHLDRILQDFLQYVGRRELQRAPHDINKLVGDLAEFYMPQARAHRVELRVSLAAEPLICNVDASVMKQAMLNLLINAQQAMIEGGDVYLRTAVHGAAVARIDVIDTGPGIPENLREKVFQAYCSTKKGGSGLGLATTRQIVREHGGSIHLYSEPPHGSCFTILLPRIEPSGDRQVP